MNRGNGPTENAFRALMEVGVQQAHFKYSIQKYSKNLIRP